MYGQHVSVEAAAREEEQTLDVRLLEDRVDVAIVILQPVVEGQQTEALRRVVVAVQKIERGIERRHFVSLGKAADLITELAERDTLDSGKARAFLSIADVVIHATASVASPAFGCA